MSHFTREAPVTPANCPTVSKVSVVLSGLSTEEEPRDLDTENEEVLTLYDDIKKILERYTKPEVKTKQEQPSILRET